MLDNADKNLQQLALLAAAYLFRQKAETGHVTKLDRSENLLPRYVAHFSPYVRAGTDRPSLTPVHWSK